MKINKTISLEKLIKKVGQFSRNNYLLKFKLSRLRSLSFISQISKKLPDNIPVTKMTEFKLAMKSNPECMLECPVESYRAFYHTKQHRFKMDWTKRKIPEWFTHANI